MDDVVPYGGPNEALKQTVERSVLISKGALICERVLH